MVSQSSTCVNAFRACRSSIQTLGILSAGILTVCILAPLLHRIFILLIFHYLQASPHPGARCSSARIETYKHRPNPVRLRDAPWKPARKKSSVRRSSPPRRADSAPGALAANTRPSRGDACPGRAHTRTWGAHSAEDSLLPDTERGHTKKKRGLPEMP